MNIFYLDRNPYKAAEKHYNKHVVKMVLEAAQLLCTAHHIEGNPDDVYITYQLISKQKTSVILHSVCQTNIKWPMLYKAIKSTTNLAKPI